MGRYDEPGTVLPFNALFSHLRDQWLSRDDTGAKRTSTSLAKHLDVRPQRVSQWATGTDATRGDPPWWVILSLCEDLNLEVRINADDMSVVRRRRDPNSRASVIREQDAHAEDKDACEE